MGNRDINRILKDHSIVTFYEGERLFALEECYDANNRNITVVVDVTSYNLKEVREFLGY